MKATIASHIVELRKRFVTTLVFFIIFFLAGVSIAPRLIKLVIDQLLPKFNVYLVASTPFDFFLTTMKTGMLISIALTLPLFLYNFLKYVNPALTEKEKRSMEIILPISFIFLISGALFNYFFFLKFIIPLLAEQATSASILNLWNVNRFVSFIFFTCLLFGLIFQLPLVMILLSKTGLVNDEKLARSRKYAFIIILAISALITPPDVITLLISAVVLWLLYEVGILLVRIFS